ncbi:hypothetical protein JCM8547_003682 [Rhodosporidiobolus lusitaniae]
MSDDSDAYSFPSDDEAYLSDVSLPAEPAPPPAPSLAVPLVDLDDFRSSWTEEVNAVTERRTKRIRMDESSHPAAVVFKHPHILPLILADSSLSLTDLYRLAQLNSVVRFAAQKLMYCDLSIASFGSAERLAKAVTINPQLLQHCRTTKISLGDIHATLAGLPSVKPLLNQVRAEHEEQEAEYYKVDAGGVRLCRPWRARVLQEIGWGATEMVVQQVGRRHEVLEAVRRRREEEEKSPKLLGELRTALSRWPFSARKAPDTTLQHLLSNLFATARDVTLTYPLSHYYPAIASLFTSSTSLTSLTILGKDPLQTFPDPIRISITAPKAPVSIRSDGRGIEGAPSSLKSLHLDEVTLLQPSPHSPPSAFKPTSSTPPILEDLTLHRLTALPSTGSSLPSLQLAELPPPDQPQPIPPSRSSNPPPLSLSFDLSRFLGVSAGAGSARLTSLTLVDVDGLAPLPLVQVVEASARTLKHLTLQNVNVGGSRTSELSRGVRGILLAENGTVVKHSFSLSSSLSSSPILTVATTADRTTFSAISHAALSLAAPSPIHSTLFSHLPSALSLCSSLVTLRLSTSPALSSNSPFSPRILDALLEARPPLEELRLRFGVGGPSSEEGRMTVGEWEEVQGKVWRLTKECTGLRREVSSVGVVLRV